jgi:hypothetical protein
LEVARKTLRKAVAQVLRGESQQEAEDRSFAKALAVLRDMKKAGKTWQEMGERLKQDFGTSLDKDQLKALVR